MKSISKKTLLRIILPAFVIIAIAVGVFFFINRGSDDSVSNSQAGDTNSSKQVTKPGGTVNMDPPTEEEKQAGDQQKQENVDKENQPAPTTANVNIVDASQYNDLIEVRAYVSNVIEASGNCVITLEQAGKQVTKTVVARADAKTTQCTTIDIPRNEIPSAGTWNVTVNYNGSISGQAKTTLKVT